MGWAGKNSKSRKMGKKGVQRTLAERQAEVRPIIEKMVELGLNTACEEGGELYKLMKRYVQEGERVEVSIPFPAAGGKLTGVLATNVREQVWVKIEKNR